MESNRKKNPLPRVAIWTIFVLLESLCIRFYLHSLSEIIVPSFSTQDQDSEDPNALQSMYAHTPMTHDDFLKRSRITQEETHEEEKVGKNWQDLPEKSFPKSSQIMDYYTSATELEIEKHDRLLVQGMVFMKQQMSHPDMIELYTPSPQQKEQQFICLNIYLCNRSVPYINALLMSMLSHSSTDHVNTFLETTQVRMLNTEKRPGKTYFPYMTNVLSKLPFIHKVHDVNYSDKIYRLQWDLDFREQFISDEISGLNICIESGLPYCIMMEEDAVVPVDFTSLLLEHVIGPLEKEGILNRAGKGQVSLISLYSYYNLVHFGEERLHYSSYAKERYRQERAKSNAERFSEGLPPYAPNYKVTEKVYKYGTVAILYTRESAIKLVDYLRSVGVEPIHNADEFINAEEYFPEVMQIPRRHVEPSLVNHIGFYSERMGSGDKMFSQLNTDVRFMYDAGRTD